MKTVTIEEKEYKVSEYIGFQPSSGTYNCFVDTDDGEKMAVRYPKSKTWKFWTVNNRLGKS